MKSYMNIAIFGDLHGRVLLAFDLVRRWQEEHRETIDHILCVGDVGVYRSKEFMDKASLRYAAKFPEEMGFIDFFYVRDPEMGNRFIPVARVDEILKGLEANLYFVPGNHEDHTYLGLISYEYSKDSLHPQPVDVDWEGKRKGLYQKEDFQGYRRIYFLPQGPVVKLKGKTSPDIETTLRTINGLDKYTALNSWDRLQRGPGGDILLTHETYQGRLKGFDETGRRDHFGSEKLKKIIERSGPKWHFFGHHHWYYPPITLTNQRETRSVGMNQLFLEGMDSHLPMGAFGILKVEQKEKEKTFDFAPVEDPWYLELRKKDLVDVLFP